MILGDDSRQPLRLLLSRRAAVGHHLSQKLTGFYRTPTFEVVGDKLWYRFRGRANVFAAVDSHRTVTGPLHGVVRQHINSPDRDAWFGHRLDDYLGHRIHIEFEPQGEFILYEVRFGEHQPPEIWQTNEYLDASLQQAATLADLAEATAAAFGNAIARVEPGVEDPATAELVNWILAHDDLLPPPQQELATAYQRAAAAYVVRRHRIEATIPEPQWSLAMLDGSSESEPIHIRGSHRRLSAKGVPRGILKALGGAFEIPHGSGRLALAERVVDPANPLTQRVMVNRIWQHLFGEGIVKTADNFGVLGERPTHPELLDYLASEFVADDWNIKNLIRRLVLSSTYRMRSGSSQLALQKDPADRLLHSARVRRLSGEQIRDAILSVSGELNSQRHGKSVRIHITDFMRHNRSPGWSGPMDGDHRRSIYIEVRRNALSHFLSAFDKPVPFTTVGRRAISNSAAQPLILLNDPLIDAQAKRWAAHLVSQYDSDAAAVDEAYWDAFARPPTPEEQQRLSAYLQQRLDETGDPDQRQAAWTEICRTLFNVKEFIFLP